MELADVVLPYLNWYNEYIGRYVLMFLLVPAGVYFTWKLRLPQLFKLRHAFDITLGRFDDAKDTGDVSHFQALCAALSGTVGTGNIAGVALAIAIGGPGAMFWIWVTGFLGMATKMVEVTLAQKFRVVHEDGSVSGGGMYYISQGLKGSLGWLAPVMAFLFAVAAVTCSFGTGNMAQSNSIVASLSATTARIVSWSSGAVVAVEALPWWLKHALAAFNALVVWLVIVGGIKRIGAVADKLVPAMAAFYLASAALVILGAVEPPVACLMVVGAFLSWLVPSRLHANRGKAWAAISATWVLAALALSAWLGGTLWRSVELILRSAFTGQAAVGGFAGASAIYAIQYGLARGLFSNEAGQGSAPIAHAAAKTKHPLREGMVSLLEPFIDTLVICTLTCLVIVFTGAWTSGKRGVELTALAFEQGLQGLHPWLAHYGFYLVTVSLFLFAISTAISWAYYGERAALYLMGPRSITPFRYCYCIFTYLGGIFSLDLVWTFCDTVITFMAFPNLVAILLLSPIVFKLMDEYQEPELPRAG